MSGWTPGRSRIRCCSAMGFQLAPEQLDDAGPGLPADRWAPSARRWRAGALASGDAAADDPLAWPSTLDGEPRHGRAAYETLATAGVVAPRVGRGTFVGGPRPAGGSAGPPRAARCRAWRSGCSSSSACGRLRKRERRGADPRPRARSGALPARRLPPRARAACSRRRARRCSHYGEPQGHPGCARCWRSAWARGVGRRRRHRACQGATQGIALALRLFADPGDAVAVEAPTYPNVLATLAALGLRTVPVPMRDGGADLEALERALARPDVKRLLHDPDLPQPARASRPRSRTAARCSRSRRAHGKPVIEDDFQLDLRSRAEPCRRCGRSTRRAWWCSCSRSRRRSSRARASAGWWRAAARRGAARAQARDGPRRPAAAPGRAGRFSRAATTTATSARAARVARAARRAAEALARHLPAGSPGPRPRAAGGVGRAAERLDTRAARRRARARRGLHAGALFQRDGRPSRGLRLAVGAWPTRPAIRAASRALGRARPRALAGGAARGGRTPIHV